MADMIPKRVNKVCLIDDDATYIFLISRMIQKKHLDVEIVSYTNGKEAVESLHADIAGGSKLPEIILLDLNMPEMDGWQFLEYLSTNELKLPDSTAIYIVSSSIDQNDIQKAELHDFVSDCVTKPINHKNLRTFFSRKARKESE